MSRASWPLIFQRSKIPLQLLLCHVSSSVGRGNNHNGQNNQYFCKSKQRTPVFCMTVVNPLSSGGLGLPSWAADIISSHLKVTLQPPGSATHFTIHYQSGWFSLLLSLQAANENESDLKKKKRALNSLHTCRSNVGLGCHAQPPPGGLGSCWQAVSALHTWQLENPRAFLSVTVQWQSVATGPAGVF